MFGEKNIRPVKNGLKAMLGKHLRDGVKRI